MYHLQFAYPFIFSIFIPALIIFIIYRLKFYHYPTYSYPLTDTIAAQLQQPKLFPHKKILFILRVTSLIILTFLIARPQWTDSRSTVNVKGVDIMIALDVSASMNLYDNLKNPVTRIDTAKTEALRFIDYRKNDPIGLVIFAQDAVSLCPLTLDKNILKNLCQNIKLGFIPDVSTALATGLATAVSKLRYSKAKSKMIILLTDGQPTEPGEKITMDTAIELAKKQGIKIYTIGIGNKDGGYIIDQFRRAYPQPNSINEQLLQHISQETGGKAFRANNATEMKEIYKTIDALEKTKYETKLFQKKHEALTPFIWILLFIVMLELLLRLFVWRGIL